MASLLAAIAFLWIAISGSVSLPWILATSPGVLALSAMTFLSWRPLEPEVLPREVADRVDIAIIYADHDRSETEATIRAAQAVRGAGNVTIVIPADRSLPSDLPGNHGCAVVHAEETVMEAVATAVATDPFVIVRSGRMLHPDYIEKLHSLFDDPKVALVQADGHDPAAKGVTRRRTHRHRLQLGRNRWNAMIWDGTDGIVRKAPLVDAIAEGGRPSAVTIAARIQGRGGRTWLVDLPLSTSISEPPTPQDPLAVAQQKTAQRLSYAIGPDVPRLLLTTLASAVAFPWINLAWTSSGNVLPWLASFAAGTAIVMADPMWARDILRRLARPPMRQDGIRWFEPSDISWVVAVTITTTLWIGVSWQALHGIYGIPGHAGAPLGSFALLCMLLAVLLQGDPAGSALRIVASIPIELGNGESDPMMGAVDILDDAGLQVWTQEECPVGSEVHGHLHFLGSRIPLCGAVLRSRRLDGNWCADIQIIEIARERIGPLHRDETPLAHWATRWTGAGGDVSKALTGMQHRRRQAPRNEIHLPILLHGPDGPILAMSENASATGLGIMASVPLSIDESVVVDILHPRMTRGIEARVVRSEEIQHDGRWFLGIAFDEPCEDVAAASQGSGGQATITSVPVASSTAPMSEDHQDPLSPIFNVDREEKSAT